MAPADAPRRTNDPTHPGTPPWPGIFFKTLPMTNTPMNPYLDIHVYTKPGCPNCDVVKRLLTSKGLPYRLTDLAAPDDLAAFMQEFPDARQMPQVFINGQRVGGVAGTDAVLKVLGP